MSTTETSVIPAVPVRRPILPLSGTPGGAAQLSATALAGRRYLTPTGGLPAVPARRSGPARGATVRRHLRCALVGTLLAVVAVTGLSSYAAAGVADARSTAVCQAHVTCP